MLKSSHILNIETNIYQETNLSNNFYDNIVSKADNYFNWSQRSNIYYQTQKAWHR